MGRLISLVKNRYVIAGVIFTAWIIFFDRHDLSSQFDYYNNLKSLQAEKAYYEAEIGRMQQTIQDLETNPAVIERIAREKYQMKRDAEDVFVILREE